MQVKRNIDKLNKNHVILTIYTLDMNNPNENREKFIHLNVIDKSWHMNKKVILFVAWKIEISAQDRSVIPREHRNDEK